MLPACCSPEHSIRACCYQINLNPQSSTLDCTWVASALLCSAMIRSVPISSLANWKGCRQPILTPLWHRSCNIITTRRPMRPCMAGKELNMEAQQKQQQTDVMHLLADAHCHPQLDPANMREVLNLQACHLAAMSVSYDVDWEIMLQLHKLAGRSSSCCSCSPF